MKTKKLLVAVAILLLLAVMTACGSENPMRGVALAETGEVYGFWRGLWDGLTASWAFVFNLFGGHYGIYEVHNNGGWYDFGFLLGMSMISGGSASAASRRRSSS